MNAGQVEMAPVMLMLFRREYTLQQVFNRVREAKPTTLFLVCDGGRNAEEWKKVNACRDIVDDSHIDWPCKVIRYYYDENVGMYKALYHALKKAFDVVDRLIFLEDDILTSKTFFDFCSYNLEKYKDDERIQMICGCNQNETYNSENSDYFFSEIGSIWGFAIWKRVYDSFKYNILDTITEDEEKTAESNAYRKARIIFRNTYRKNKEGQLSEDQKIAFEYINGINMYTNNRLNLVASKNMVSCLGVGEGTAHSKNKLKCLTKPMQKIFFMKTYEYEFPLRDPQYVFNDRRYVKTIEKIMGWESPIQELFRMAEGFVRSRIYR